ncbi:MAG: tetratricopeptide repeat protein [Myxococcota bacterium]
MTYRERTTGNGGPTTGRRGIGSIGGREPSVGTLALVLGVVATTAGCPTAVAPPAPAPSPPATPAPRTPCELGPAEACLERAEEEGKNDRPERALELLVQACDAGSGLGCLRAGKSRYEGVWVEKNRARALDLYRAGCALEDGRSCDAAGMMLLRGEDTEKDVAGAVILLAKACETAFLPNSCRLSGALLARGDEVEADPERAGALLRLGCDLEDRSACVELGVLYFGEKLGADKLDRAANLFAHACRRGSAVACRNAGVTHLRGKGTPKDEVAAIQAMEEGCKLRDEPACMAFARMLEEGTGVAAADAARAVEVRRESCDRGFEKACQQGKKERAKKERPKRAPGQPVR